MTGRKSPRIGASCRTAGKIKGFSTPAALALSPARLQANRQKLQRDSISPRPRQALETAITDGRIQPRNIHLRFHAARSTDKTRRAVSARCRIGARQLPQKSSWWFLVDRYFAQDPLLTTGFVTTHEPITTQEQKEMLQRELPVPGVPMVLSGWSFTLTDLVPWSHRQLILISALMAVFDATLLALLYRDWRLWLIQVATLAMAVCAMIASMKLLHIPLNLLNVLAFRLVLAIGVDYGIYVLLVWQKARAARARRGRRGETGHSRRPDRDRGFRFARIRQ